MANRSIQAKVRKIKRRHRYARFSGSTTKTITKTIQCLEHLDDDKVRLKEIEVYVGTVSLSKQVPKGKGPNRERLQTYYNRIRGKDPRTLAEMLGLVKDPRYAKTWFETPSINHINIYTYPDTRLDMWFEGPNWFFIDLDFERKIIRRSRDYGGRDYAMAALRGGNITWVEQLPMISEG